ncbi:zinc finger protein 626-like [Cydia pomonella]|uniref:zinc finger protein 626-like n=1 Tax=Cydia pomonella TaxID=82600 RepID=UPI002ADD92D7|nr:zinc finger protein 626-like [Cydia pomonella]
MAAVKSEAAADLRACRICLATDTKLFGIYEQRLDEAFIDIMGTTLSVWDGCPQHLCALCGAQLIKAQALRARAHRADALLKQALMHQHIITTSYLATLDRVSQQLALCLSIHHPAIMETTHNETKQEMEDDDFDMYHPEFDEPIINLKNTMLLESMKETELHAEDIKTDMSEMEIKEEEPVKKRKDKVRREKVKVKRDKSIKTKKKVQKVQEVEEEQKEPKKYKRKLKGFKKFFASEDDYIKFENTYNIEIVKLSEEEQQKELDARKESSNYLRSAYRCERCFKGFLSHTTFENHQKKTHDPSNGRNECVLCGARFRHPAGLRKHFESHTLKFICKICQFMTRHRSMAVMHADFHSGKTFVCKYCGLTFNKQTTFNTHTRVQHPLENASAGTCDVCGETFTGKRGLQQHKAIAHKKLTTPELKCRSCLVQFENVDAKTRHKINNVCDPKFRPCPACGERFEDEERAKKHYQDHHVKEHYKCDQCDTTFAKKSSLAVHFERVHLKIKPKKPAFYKYHQYGKGRMKIRNAEICEICGKGYPDTTWLRYHQRTHTGERPYKCAQCPKSYMTPAGLQRHAVIHTGVRRWQCAECPKTFLHQSSIYTHKLVHTGEKPYVCQICSKAFTQSGSLQTHVKYVHMKLKPPPRRRRQELYKPPS